MQTLLIIAILMILVGFLLTHFEGDTKRQRIRVGVWIMRLTVGGLILGAIYTIFR
jgi:hypothetical protein